MDECGAQQVGALEAHSEALLQLLEVGALRTVGRGDQQLASQHRARLRLAYDVRQMRGSLWRPRVRCDPKNVVGAVSRTANSLMRPSLDHVRSRLSPASRDLLTAAIDEADVRDEALWVVGGAARDCALDIPVVDLDLATDGDPLPLARAVAERVDGVAEGWPRFGTECEEWLGFR